MDGLGEVDPLCDLIFMKYDKINQGDTSTICSFSGSTCEDLLPMERSDYITAESANSSSINNMCCNIMNEGYPTDSEANQIRSKMIDYHYKDRGEIKYSNTQSESGTRRWVETTQTGNTQLLNCQQTEGKLPTYRTSEHHNQALSSFALPNNDNSDSNEFESRKRHIVAADTSLKEIHSDDFEATYPLPWIEQKTIIPASIANTTCGNSGGYGTMISCHSTIYDGRINTRRCPTCVIHRGNRTFYKDTNTISNMFDYTYFQPRNNTIAKTCLHAFDSKTRNHCRNCSIIADSSSCPCQRHLQSIIADSSSCHCQRHLQNCTSERISFQNNEAFSPVLNAKFPTSWASLQHEWINQSMESYLTEGIRSSWRIVDQQRYSKRYRGIKMIRKVALTSSLNEHEVVIKLDTDRGQITCSNHLLALEHADKSILRRKRTRAVANTVSVMDWSEMTKN